MDAERRPAGFARVATILLAFAAACDAPTVPRETPAYDPRLPVGGNEFLVYRWPAGHTVRFYATPGATSGGFAIAPALEHAADAWRDVLRFGELEFRIVATPGEADIVVHDVGETLVDFPEGCAGLLGFGGVTSFCATAALDRLLPLPLRSGTPGRVRFDIALDGTRVTSESGFRALVTHEVGHALGIGGHSPEADDVMVNAPSVESPSPDDARTLRWVLRQTPTLRP